LKELKSAPVDGWFKLLSDDDAVINNIPISYSKRDNMRMSMDSISLLDNGFYYGKKTEITDYKLDTKISESGKRQNGNLRFWNEKIKNIHIKKMKFEQKKRKLQKRKIEIEKKIK